jgi:hypothetical protein
MSGYELFKEALHHGFKLVSSPYGNIQFLSTFHSAILIFVNAVHSVVRKYENTWYNKLTPWCRTLLQGPKVAQLVKKLSPFYGTQIFFTVFTKTATGLYPWPVVSSPCYLFYIHFIIPSSNIHLFFQIAAFLRDFRLNFIRIYIFPCSAGLRAGRLGF